MEILKANQLYNIIKSLNFKDTEADKIGRSAIKPFLRYVHVFEVPQEEITKVPEPLILRIFFIASITGLNNTKYEMK